MPRGEGGGGAGGGGVFKWLVHHNIKTLGNSGVNKIVWVTLFSEICDKVQKNLLIKWLFTDISTFLWSINLE